MSFAEKIKALFSDEAGQVKVETVETEVTEQKFLDIPVGDRMFRVDTETLVEGSYIFEVVMEEVDGVEQEVIKKVEDGEYTLEDGTIIMVEADTVVSIKTPEEEPVEEVIIDEAGSVEEVVVSEFESAVFDSFEKLKEEMKSLSEINKSLKEELASLKEDFSNQLEEIKKLPGSESVSFKKQGFKFAKKENDYARLQDLSKYRK